MSRFNRIITHNDFDGVISATICSYALGIDFVVFTGPRTVSDARISITSEDIVCDLPYPLECGLWFDHHEGNLEELEYRQIDPASIEGRFELKDSCAHVVYEYFSEKQNLPDHFKDLVREADIIDAFNYSSIDDWRAETPAKIIDGSIKVKVDSANIKWKHLRNLISQLKTRPLEQVAKTPGVEKFYHIFQNEEQAMMEQIQKDVLFLPQDTNRELVIIDLTKHNRQPNVLKHLAYLLFPNSLAVLEVKNMFQNRVKTNNLSFSMSLSINLNSNNHNKDVGAIMRDLNIGSGHPGAGAGTISCDSKNAMLQSKQAILSKIFAQFKDQ